MTPSLNIVSPRSSLIIFGFILFLEASAAAASPVGGTEMAVVEKAPARHDVIQPSASALAPSLTAIAEAWREAHGGLATGSRWNYLVDLSLDLDLEKVLGGPEGSTFLIQALGVQRQHNVSFSELAGAFNPSSGAMAANQIRLYNFHYRQSWREDAVVFKVGQQAADDDFMGSDYSGLFMNSSFGAMPSQVATALAESRCRTAAFPAFAVAAPGMFLAVHPNDSSFVQAAVYVGSPGEDISRNHGFDWETSSDAGVACFYEAGRNHQLGGLAGAVKLGGTLHSGRFDQLAAQNAGLAAATARGLYSFYAIIDQALLLDEKGDTVIGAFWRGGISPQQDRSVVRTYSDAGLVLNRPFGRSDDAVGLGIAHTRFGSEFAAKFGPDGIARDETTIELTYRAQLTSRLAVQADVQWLFDPAFSAISGGRDTALVLGVRTELSF